MKLLLDTHLLLWAASGTSERMSREAASLISDEGNELLFSAVSIWEVAIKSGLGRPDFRSDPHVLRRTLLDNGYGEAAITGAHAAAVSRLPPIHRDPFDRMLIAQAISEGYILLTSDRTVADYGAPVQSV